jgi:hypothetical protein
VADHHGRSHEERGQRRECEGEERVPEQREDDENRRGAEKERELRRRLQGVTPKGAGLGEPGPQDVEIAGGDQGSASRLTPMRLSGAFLHPTDSQELLRSAEVQ